MHKDIIIIGGGIIGMLSARELAAAGARVTIIDKSHWGQESSWAGGGILSPLYPWRYSGAVNRLAYWSQQTYQELSLSLHAATGIDPQWTRSGLLVLDQEQQSEAKTWARDYSMPAESITPAQDPRFRCQTPTPDADALWFPEIAHIRNPRLLQALHQELEASGVDFRLHHEVTGFEQSANRVHTALTTAGPVAGEQFLICAGAWSGVLAQTLRLNLAITPVKGQMLLFDAKPDTVPCMVLQQGRYLIPRQDGKVLVGSTLEHTGFEKKTTDAARQELFDFAVSVYPALSGFPIQKHWAGLRPGIDDGVPVIDQHPDFDNVFINTGHYRNGVVLAPASSRLICNIIMAQPPILDPSPYKIQ